MRQAIILLSILFLTVSVTYARNYYIDAGGNDEHDGSLGHPWRTLAAVGRVRLAAGDSVFFRGGQIFHGVLRIDHGGSAGSAGRGGNVTRWVWIGSYGRGPATIDAGDSAAVVLEGVEWVRVSGLRLVGAGRKDGNVKDGLDLVHCHHVRVSGVDITGFQKSGLLIYSSTDIVIERVSAHENGAAGIAVEGSAGKRESRNLKILYCRTDDNPGDPTNLTNHSGNGIVAGHCTNLLIDHCSATNNGWDMPRIGNGPVGIWCYEADSVTIQHCLAYRNKTSVGGADGGGFDLDGGVTNSVIQYCLSYGNQGSGYCIFQYWGASPWYHNIVRWNISEDDGGVSDSRAGVYVWNSSGDSSQFYDCKIYNNTIYNSKEAAISFSTTSARRGFVFYNNIFVGADSLVRGDRGVDIFRRNDWWVLRGKGSPIGNPIGNPIGAKGLYIKPDFKDPGHTQVTTVEELKGYDKYRIGAASPLHGLGAGF
jgi:Right handed beta helix region